MLSLLFRIRGSHLYKLFRKEFVRTNPDALSSDVFTSTTSTFLLVIISQVWGSVNREVLDGDAIRATFRLLRETIPETAASLGELLAKDDLSVTTEFSVSQFLAGNTAFSRNQFKIYGPIVEPREGTKTPERSLVGGTKFISIE